MRLTITKKVIGAVLIMMLSVMFLNTKSTTNFQKVRSTSVTITEFTLPMLEKTSELMINIERIQKFVATMTASDVTLEVLISNGQLLDKAYEEAELLISEMNVLKETQDSAFQNQYDTVITDYYAYINGIQAVLEFADGWESISLSQLITKLTNSMDIFMEAVREDSSEIATRLYEDAQQTIDTNATFGVVQIVLFLLVIVLALFNVVFPTRKATKRLNEIIEDLDKNEGDLTKRIDMHMGDEIGELIQGVNLFMDKLQSIMQNIKQQSEQLNTASDTVLQQVQKADNNVNDVSATMEQLSASMEEVAATVEHMTNAAEALLSSAQEIADNAVGGSEFANSISVRANNLNQTAIQSKKTAGSMVTEIRGSMESAIENSKNVEKINELTNDILKIAAQTNLLALNASIEAARAGEAGRGFAVVADEIRQLADNSKNIANNIQKISHMVTQAVENLAEGSDKMLYFIDTTVLNDYDKIVDITAQYSKDAYQVDQMMDMFDQGAGTLKSTIADMAESFKGIGVTIDESAQGITMTAQSAGDLVDSVHAIRMSSDINDTIAQQLQKEVNNFKKI